jgi:hypothetical protein
MTDVDQLTKAFLAEHPVCATEDRVLREARFDAGLALLHFDAGTGGVGLSPETTERVERRFLEAGADDWADRNVIGLGMASGRAERTAWATDASC